MTLKLFTAKKIDWAKLILFLSAYIPLFIIIGIKYFFQVMINFEVPYIKWNVSIPIIPLIVSIIIICLVYYFKKIIENSLSVSEKFFHVNQIDEKNDIILTYLVPYFFSFVSIKTTEEFICYLVIFLIIFMIYINSEILYINPIFLFLRYNFYKIKINNVNILLISKIDINRKIGKRIGAKQIDTRVYMVSDDNG